MNRGSILVQGMHQSLQYLRTLRNEKAVVRRLLLRTMDAPEKVSEKAGLNNHQLEMNVKSDSLFGTI